MKVSLFSPLLISLIIILVIKASMLFGRIEEQANYEMDTSVSSILIDTAYAKNDKDADHSNKVSKNHVSDNIAKNNKSITKSNNSSVRVHLTGDQIDTEQEAALANLNSSELKLNKELSIRRNEIEKIADEVDIKRQVLEATENKIDQKIAELKSVQSKLEVIMKQYDQKEQGKIMSLVKIYENMKPKDAAKIFDELEMPVLVSVISNMKEIKVAPIIAAMNPLRARDISLELARQKTLSN